MSNETFDSVWDAIEDTAAEAKNMKLRSGLMMALEQHINRQGWTQGETAKRLGITQPRVSDLMRGKIHLFGLDTLVKHGSSSGAACRNTRTGCRIKKPTIFVHRKLPLQGLLEGKSACVKKTTRF